MPIMDDVDIEIRWLITELMDSAPSAPSSIEVESSDPIRYRPAKSQWLRSRTVGVVGGLAVVTVTALLLAVLLPSAGDKVPVAEAAQLRLIASGAARQPVLRLGPNQWLRTTQVFSISFQANQPVPSKDPWGNPTTTETPIPNASATSRVVSIQWYNNVGQACFSERLGPLTFKAKINRDAWRSAGLTTNPSRQPLDECPNYTAANAESGFAQGIGAVDVSALPSDPPVLARELSTGTTGIPGLAQSRSGGNEGFSEAVTLLVGPVTGKTASFSSELYQAIALIPGVHKLGQVTTGTGSTGLGYSADTEQGQTTIIVNPDSGALLEVRNHSFRGAPNIEFLFRPVLGANFAQVQPIGATIQWTDPVGSRSIVDTSALPPVLNPPSTPVAVIVARAKPDVGGVVNVPGPPKLNDPFNVLERELTARFGAPGGGFAFDPVPGAEVLYLDFNGARSQVENWAQALRSSNLMSSVVVNWGDVSTTTPGA